MEPALLAVPPLRAVGATDESAGATFTCTLANIAAVASSSIRNTVCLPPVNSLDGSCVSLPGTVCRERV